MVQILLSPRNQPKFQSITLSPLKVEKMQVRYVVKKTDSMGLGVFADEDIKEGTLVYKHLPGINSIKLTLEEVYKKLSEIENDVIKNNKTIKNKTELKQLINTTVKDTFLYHLCWDNDENNELQPVLYTDDAKYFNHSYKNDNICVDLTGKIDATMEDYFAIRDIKKGEQLLENYIKTYSDPIDYFEWPKFIRDIDEKYEMDCTYLYGKDYLKKKKD